MKVTVFYGYSADNAGDMAITVGVLDLLNERFDEISIFSRYYDGSISYEQSKVYLENKYNNLKVLPCPFILDRTAGVIKSFYNYSYSCLKYFGLISNDSVQKEIDESSLVLFNGGNLLRCTSLVDFLRIKALFHPFKYASKKGVPYIVLPQSTSGVNWYGHKELERMLDNANAVYIREEKSFNKLESSFPNANILRSCDAALFIEFQRENRNCYFKGYNFDNKTVAITIRAFTLGDLKPFGEDKMKSICKRVIDFVVQASFEGYSCTFVIQCEKDRTISERIISSLHDMHSINCKTFSSNDPVELGLFYKNCDLLFGMRLHSIILAVANGTPCYGYFDESWGLKNPGFMNMFDLSFEFIDSSVEKESLNISDYVESNGHVLNKFKNITEGYKDDIIHQVMNSLV